MLESPSSTLALRNQLRLSRPGSYYFGAGGGLGFGLSAAVGVQLAQPDRPVVCVIGEGSVQYAVTAFWTAAAYDVPVTFLVLRNSEYAILKWFAAIEGVERRAGARPARLDTAAIAAGYGVGSCASNAADELREALGRGDRLRPAGAGRGRGRAGHVAVLRARGAPDGAARAEGRAARAARRSPPAPTPRRIGSRRARRSRCAASSMRCSAPTGCSTRALDLVRYASDASPYRLFPKAVVMAHDADDVAKVIAYGRRTATPVTFRAGGTSLNGQGQSDGILVDVRRHFRGVAVERDGARARVGPGTVLGHANRVLAPHGHKLGPDPASTDIACVGGVIANNSGGMRCGVTHDSYRRSAR